MSRLQVGVDIGGTFTDIVALDGEGRLTLTKVPSTPKDLLDGIAAALHIHLDAHTCLEVITLRGRARRIRSLADSLMAVKGVHYGKLVPATTGKGLG